MTRYIEIEYGHVALVSGASFCSTWIHSLTPEFVNEQRHAATHEWWNAHGGFGGYVEIDQLTMKEPHK